MGEGEKKKKGGGRRKTKGVGEEHKIREDPNFEREAEEESRISQNLT